MKNSEIHTGLDQKEVRDFLAKEMAKTCIPHKSKTPNGSLDPLDWAIEGAKNARDLAERQIRDLEIRKAILHLIKKMGWDEFDVSDYVTLDFDMYLNFVGTQEDYDVFKIKLNI